MSPEELAPLLGSPATSGHVCARWGAASEATFAEQVFALVMVAQADWAHRAVAGAAGPASACEIEAALEPVGVAGAIELMTNLSAFDPVHSRRLLRERGHAEGTAPSGWRSCSAEARAGSRTRGASATAARGRPSPGTASMPSLPEAPRSTS